MAVGSVTEAAQQMNVSQPAVSKHLRLMEANLGFDLFTRSGNHLVATPEANALYEQVEQVYAGMDELSRFAADLQSNRHGELILAAMPLVAHGWLPQIIANFAKDHDGVSMSVAVRSTDWIARTTAAGRVDLGIGLSRRVEPGIKSTPLMQLPLTCICSQDHPLAGVGTLSPKDLRDHQIITLSNFDRWPLKLNQILEGSGALSRRRLEVFTAQMACELALSGAGVAIVDLMTAMAFSGAASSISRFSPDLFFEITLMEPKHGNRSRVVSALADVIIAEASKSEAALNEALNASRNP